MILALFFLFSIFAQAEESSLHSDLLASWANLSIEEHLDYVYSLQNTGRYDSAEERLHYLLQRESSAVIQFELARNLELQERYSEALEGYNQISLKECSADLRLNILYRQALVLSDLQQEKEALKMVRRLRRRIFLSKTDRRGIRLLLGATEIKAGKKNRGIRRIQRTLNQLDSDHEHPWLQSKARLTLAEELLDSASDIEIIANDSLDDSLRQRANLIVAAERQVQMIISLNEPEQALIGLSQVADAMLMLYDDVILSPAPESFTTSQREIYQEELEERAKILQHKSLSYYSTALRYANQLEWKGAITEELKAKYSSLQQEL